MKIYQQLLFGALFLLIAHSISAQKGKDTLNIDGHADCASRLKIETLRTIGPTTSPQGHGNTLEFSKNPRTSLYFMEQENNSVWYEFTTTTSGEFTFEIEPLDSLNDYDFALYKYTDENFCADVKRKKILPLRTNFSRNKIEILSKTGLKTKSKDIFVAAGINSAYSASVDVKAKEKYVLLISNVYDNGAGHTLYFDYSVNLKRRVVVIERERNMEANYNVDLKGQVVAIEGEENMEANITLTNTETGIVVAETTSDSVTGAYKLMFDLPKSQMNDPLHLEVVKDGYFFYDTLVTAFKLKTNMRNIKLKTPIKKLKKGTKFVVSNILFHGGSPKPLRTSLPTFKALFKTLKRNKKLRIKIEGHTNGCEDGEQDSQNLSDARAATIYDFLIENEIDPRRLDAIGYGCRMMLHDINSPSAYLNRRVEIEIIDF